MNTYFQCGNWGVDVYVWLSPFVWVFPFPVWKLWVLLDVGDVHGFQCGN